MTLASTSRRFSKGDSTDFRIISAVVLSSAITLAYVYAVDHYIFSSQFMSGIFRYLLKTTDGRTAWLTLGVSIIAACWRRPAPMTILVDFLSAHVVAVSTLCVVFLALGTVFIYQNNAFSMDEYAEVFQAKVFAAGQLTAHLPVTLVNWLVPPGFNGGFLVASRTTGEAIEVYWPGFSLILALFEVLRVPWLCNPCLTGIAVFLIHRITLEITGDFRAAGWAVLFALASGVFLAYGISYYSMQARLAINLLFTWLLLKPTRNRTFGAGIAGSLALVIHSPVLHALFAAPWIIYMARSKEQRRFLLQLAAGYLPLLAFVGAGWLHLRGAISANPSDLDPITNNASTVFGFPNASMLDKRAAEMVKMWIWAVPGLFLFALLGWIRCSDDYRIRLLMQSVIVTFLGYFFLVFDQGHGWGYRYFHSAWGVIPILAGCGMMKRQESGHRLAAFAGAAALLNLLVVVPYQMTQIHNIIALHSAQIPEPRRPGGNVYFIKIAGGFYSADLVQLDPLLRQPDLFLFSQGEELDAKLRRQNWPAAVLVERRNAVEQWWLGPTKPGPFTVDDSGRISAQARSP